MRNLVFFMLFGILLAGCGEKLESVCSKSGGDCCAVRYGDNGNGSYSSTVYACRPTAESCLDLANKYGGTPDFPHKIDIGTERDKCEAKVKWGSILSTIENFAVFALAESQKSDVIRDSGTVVREVEADYCKIACETGVPGLCPVVPVANDTSLGLLKTFVDLAETVTEEEKITTMESVLSNFALTTAANGCQRGDVVSSTKGIVNLGQQQCDVESSPVINNSKEQAILSIPIEVAGQPLPAMRTIVWQNDSTTIRLKLSNAALAARYSGPIVAATRVDYQGLAAKIKGEKSTNCAEVVGKVATELNVATASSVIEKNPGFIKRSLQSFAAYRSDLEKKLSASEKQRLASISVLTRLFPNEDYISEVNSIARNNSVAEFTGADVLRDGNQTLSVGDVIRMIDIQMCSDANAARSLSDLVALVPKAGTTNELEKLSVERGKIAGQIIQCKFSAAAISPKTQELLRNYLK
ncbi:UNVERIFIED_ORG: hypothetical protein J2S29_002762 [Rhizobium sp. SLBN-170]